MDNMLCMKYTQSSELQLVYWNHDTFYKNYQRMFLIYSSRPRLTWFYDAFVNHEYKQMMLNWQDTVEEMTRKFLANSKEQLDYYLLHKEYSFIKKRALSAFLENEKKNLEKHFYDRTADMLKNIENMENNNVKNTIRRVTEESLQTVLRRLNNPEERKNLHKSTFNSALQGLRMGKMTYEGDVVLPMLLDEIKSRLDPLTKLTKEEESSMFQLTPEQKRSLIDSDNRAKIQYLAQAPDVASAAVKNADAYKNIVSRMKRRVESTFKL